MKVSKTNPNDFVVFDGPAVVHLNVEKGNIILASDVSEDVQIVTIDGRQMRKIQELVGTDPAAIIAHIKGQDDDGQTS